MASSDLAAPGVGRRLTSTLVVLVALLVAGGGAGVLSAALSAREMSRLAESVQPATEANHQVLQAITDAELALRAWALVADKTSPVRFRAATEAFERDQTDLERHARSLPEIVPLVERQRRAWTEWQRDYTATPLASPGGLAPVDAAPVGAAPADRGVRLSIELHTVNRGIDQALAGAAVAATERTSDRTLQAAAIVVLVTLTGLLLVTRWSRRLYRDVRDPLEHLQEVVHRIAGGDTAARAQEVGPREVRLVARALNHLAAESARARAAESIVQAEVRALDSARGDLVSNVSHELRTPLTSISGYVELLEAEGVRPDADQHELFAAIHRNIRRLRTLVDDLLTLSHAESSATAVEPVDLVELAEDVVGDLRLAAGRREIEVRTALPPARVLVNGDHDQLQRALTNVVSNAVKFSRRGGVVDVTVQPPGVRGGNVALEVVDRGIGIPEDDLGQIGTRFFRASNAVRGQVPGTGLGLRIVQTIVDNHGGRLRLSSAEGDGTTVVISLPPYLSAVATVPAPRDEAARAERELAPGSGR